MIALLGLAVYLNTFHCAFHFNDQSSIVDNPVIRHLRLGEIWKYWPSRFLFYLSLALNYHFSGLDVVSYHAVNLFCHIITAILVWQLVLLTLTTSVLREAPVKINEAQGRILALLTGLIFVSHPIQTETVTYITQRSTGLAALFYLGSLYFYGKSRLTEEGPEAQFLYYALSFTSAVAAMFTKEIAVTLPLAILLYEVCFFKNGKALKWKFLAPFLCTILIIPLTMFHARYWANAHEIHPSALFCAIVAYLKLLIVPINQNIDHDFSVAPGFFHWPVVLGLLLLSAILWAGIRLFSTYRILSFGIFWFLLTLFPSSIIFPMSDVISEHRLYLPLMGYDFLLVFGAFYLCGTFWWRAVTAFILLVAGCNSFLTFERNKVWKDEMTLWLDAVHKSPNKARPNYHCGNIYFLQGNLDRALAYYNKALEIDPQYPQARTNRGMIFLQKNKFKEAAADFAKAISANPGYYPAYYDSAILANAHEDYLAAIADYDKAIELSGGNAAMYLSRGLDHAKLAHFSQAAADFSRVLDFDPKSIKAYNNRALIYVKMGQKADALSDYNLALEINPMDAETYANRGLLYVQLNNDRLAEEDFTKAIELDPSRSDTYNNRGLIYDQEGRFADAVADYSKAIIMDPMNVEAYNNLGIVYDQQGKFVQAIGFYKKALKINPRYAQGYANLGLALAQQGDYAKAIPNFDEAIALNPLYIDAYTNRAFSYSRQGMISEAVSDYTRILQINPHDINAYISRAANYYLLKEYGRSWDDVHKAQALGAKVNPGFLELLDSASKEAVEP